MFVTLGLTFKYHYWLESSVWYCHPQVIRLLIYYKLVSIQNLILCRNHAVEILWIPFIVKQVSLMHCLIYVITTFYNSETKHSYKKYRNILQVLFPTYTGHSHTRVGDNIEDYSKKTGRKSQYLSRIWSVWLQKGLRNNKEMVLQKYWP